MGTSDLHLESARFSRRHFLGLLPLLAAPAGLAEPTPQEPLLDIHQHTNYSGRTNEQLVAHQAFHRVTTTVLLAGAGWLLSEVGDNASCAALQADYPDMFVRFACSDPAESSTEDVLRGNIRRGAIGFGEMKFHVAVDSPEMHRVYKLADELRVPVLIHFQYETYDTGLERFHAVLRAYPKVNFIAHAQTWWANISAGEDPLDLYPTGRVKPGGLSDRLLAEYPNLYGDLSAQSGLNALTRDMEFSQGFLERHHRKLLWGSDCDCRDGKGAGTSSNYCIAERSLAALRNLAADPAMLRRIHYENGSALYGLKEF